MVLAMRYIFSKLLVLRTWQMLCSLVLVEIVVGFSFFRSSQQASKWKESCGVVRHQRPDWQMAIRSSEGDGDVFGVSSVPVNPTTEMNFVGLAQKAALISAGLFQLVSTARAESTAPVAAIESGASTVDLGPPPTDFGLIENDFYGDAAKVVRHMRYACQLEKGSPVLVQKVAQRTKREMVDFVSFYRRFRGVQGKPSFSLLYTSINVLAGHYTSYGFKVAVPEKRRRRLLQELADVERNIKRGR